MSSNDEFYVGYLSTPRRLRLWLLRTVLVVGIACTAAVAVIATGQRDPGPGIWRTDDVQTFTGTLLAEPYLMLVEDDGRSLLLTGPTKEGADAWAGDLIGKRVTLRGHAVVRGDLRLVSIAEVPAPIVPVPTPTSMRPGDLAFGVDGKTGSYGETVTLAGEIIDPKCYAGAMKPGDGKAHKACAALCIRGGIPPVLAGTSSGHTRFLVMTDSNGNRLTGDRLINILPLVAESVLVTGRESHHHGLSFLSVERVERRP